uniref:Uncharacterized protein n=1 Tax=Chaetoceros debilis TaxID=122233 RepID=A0A7S3QGG2_9STRA
MNGFDIQSKCANDSSPITRSKNGLYNFNPEPAEILSGVLKNNPISGIMFSRLIRLLFNKRQSIDWWRYKHRIVGLIFMSVFNSFLSLVEGWYIISLYASRETRELIQQAKNDDQCPVFILGHPRTGTTLLHSLLALDEERFSIFDTFMVGFPHCFLSFERMGKFLFKNILSPTRPMDSMKLHFDLPQEDELGTNILSGCTVSPYNSIIFMREEEQYRKYQCFREGEVEAEDEKKWTHWFRYLIAKVKIRDLMRKRKKEEGRSPRQVLLKSPAHTGRVRLLLKNFPKAKFIFIHRNPYEVFLSGAHMASTTYGWWFLQQPSDSHLQEYILRQGEILHDEYFSSRELLDTHVSINYLLL